MICWSLTGVASSLCTGRTSNRYSTPANPPEPQRGGRIQPPVSTGGMDVKKNGACIVPRIRPPLTPASRPGRSSESSETIPESQDPTSPARKEISCHSRTSVLRASQYPTHHAMMKLAPAIFLALLTAPRFPRRRGHPARQRLRHRASVAGRVSPFLRRLRPDHPVEPAFHSRGRVRERKNLVSGYPGIRGIWQIAVPVR